MAHDHLDSAGSVEMEGSIARTGAALASAQLTTSLIHSGHSDNVSWSWGMSSHKMHRK